MYRFQDEFVDEIEKDQFSKSSSQYNITSSSSACGQIFVVEETVPPTPDSHSQTSPTVDSIQSSTPPIRQNIIAKDHLSTVHHSVTESTPAQNSGYTNIKDSNEVHQITTETCIAPLEQDIPLLQCSTPINKADSTTPKEISFINRRKTRANDNSRNDGND